MLGQITDGGALGNGDAALVGRKLTDHNFEQGGLAGAVYADHGRFFMFLYMKGYVF